MLDFCAKKSVLPGCEMIAMQDVNDAFKQLESADVLYGGEIGRLKAALFCSRAKPSSSG